MNVIICAELSTWLSFPLYSRLHGWKWSKRSQKIIHMNVKLSSIIHMLVQLSYVVTYPAMHGILYGLVYSFESLAIVWR